MEPSDEKKIICFFLHNLVGNDYLSSLLLASVSGSRTKCFLSLLENVSLR